MPALESPAPPPAGPDPASPAADGAGPGFRLSAAAILEAARAAERAEVLAEVGLLRAETSGRMRKVLTLVISFALFMAAARYLGNPLEWLIAVAAAVIVHEAGHYAGMRLFGYSDVRMFFIPFVGGAVSGRSGGVAGWKRATVALLGPVPGLLLGLAGAALSLLLPAPEPVLYRLSWAFLLINASNLLPLLPLDGGRLVQDVLFSRNRFLDAAFRAGSGLLFLGAGLAMWRAGLKGWWVPPLFGLVVLAGAPGALQFGRMLARLRPELGELAAAGSGEIPPEAADRLIAEVRRENPRLPDARAVAWRVDLLWDRLLVRPPGPAAAAAFLAIQLLGLLAGCGGAMVLAMAAARH
ncbi:MAG TPA: hypothetical protein PK280_01145 [Planctomycetota bacterium]|nr:hypothetical protein [Planctomycetota bacterium]